jgi:predicted membrane protein
MVLWLGGFLTAAVAIEGLELLSRVYQSEESWSILAQLIRERLSFTYFGLQYGLGMLLPIAVLAIATLAKLEQRLKLALQFGSSVAILVGVFAMRWNVVIGGQLASKSMRGLLDFTPPIWGMNGVVLAGAILLLPFVIFAVVTRIIPPWQEEAAKPEPYGLQFQRRRF